MTGHIGRRTPTGVAPGTPRRYPGREHGGLSHDGAIQFVLWAGLHALPEIVAQLIRCLGVGLQHDRKRSRQFSLHAERLGPLAGKNCC